MKLKKIKISIAVLFLAIVACSTGINLFSDNDDVQLGANAVEEINKNPKEYPIFNGDASIKEHITKEIIEPILLSPYIAKKNIYKYKLEIIANDSVLNAFALPGGYIYVYTGLLKYLDSDAALAGVLGHEIAHAERRHATQRITAAYGLSMVMSIALGNNPSQTSELVANLFSGLTLLANSRANEDESDEYSIKYLQSTKYYPGSVKFFFEKLRDDGKVAKGGQGIATFLSTHPDPIERIKSTDERLKTLGIEILSYSSDAKSIYRNEYKKFIIGKLR